MYAKDSWYLINHIEHEYKYPGKYGAKGEKRQKKKKATPEQVRKQNQRNKEKKYRRLIRMNFYPGDYWVTLKYKKGTRKGLDGLKEDMGRFLRTMRKEYGSRLQPLKFIYRLEVGRYGGLHAHIVINRLPGMAYTDLIIRDAWQRVTSAGSIDYTTIREQGGCKALAEYVTKPTDEQMAGQMSLFSRDERKRLISVSSSRNLTRPEPVRKLYGHWTMRKILRDGPEPTPGYYIDMDSICSGVNRYTGLSYYHYTEIRIDQIDCRDRDDPADEGKEGGGWGG